MLNRALRLRGRANLSGIDRAVAAAGAVMFLVASAGANEVKPAEKAQPNAGVSAQALDTALKAYVAATGVQVLYETDLTRGRQAIGADINLAPEAALSSLLAGTGLTAIQTSAGVFVIVAIPSAPAALPAAATGIDRRFLAALQGAVLRSICRTSQTHPGNYRVSLELWVDERGRLVRSSLVGSSGSATTDAALLKAMEGISMQVPPPPSAPQPFVMTIDPQPKRDFADCTR